MSQDVQNEQKQSSPTIVVIAKPKSVGTAFILAFLFGPLGLLYATIAGGLIMLVASIFLFFVLPVIGAVLCWIVCIIWAVVASQGSNKNAGQGFTVNNYNK